MEIVKRLMNILSGEAAVERFNRLASAPKVYLSTRHPTKKGPSRSLGSNPMRKAKKEFVRDGGVLRKRPTHLPSGVDTGIGVNGIRGAKGGGRSKNFVKPAPRKHEKRSSFMFGAR